MTYREMVAFNGSMGGNGGDPLRRSFEQAKQESLLMVIPNNSGPVMKLWFMAMMVNLVILMVCF